MHKTLTAYIDARLNAVAHLPEAEAAKRFVERCTADSFTAYAMNGAVQTAGELSDLQKEFRDYFQRMLKEFDAAHPGHLGDADRKAFFKAIKKGWVKGEGPKGTAADAAAAVAAKEAEIAATVLSQEALTNLWATGTAVQSTKADVQARRALQGELVKTVINGIEETSQVVDDSKVIVTNPSGEEYAIDASTFSTQYEGPEINYVNQPFKSVGTRWVQPYNGEPTWLNASWGEKQRIEPGDMLACTEGAGNNGDVYRIERSVFQKDYSIIETRPEAEVASVVDTFQALLPRLTERGFVPDGSVPDTYVMEAGEYRVFVMFTSARYVHLLVSYALNPGTPSNHQMWCVDPLTITAIPVYREQDFLWALDATLKSYRPLNAAGSAQSVVSTAGTEAWEIVNDGSNMPVEQVSVDETPAAQEAIEQLEEQEQVLEELFETAGNDDIWQKTADDLLNKVASDEEVLTLRKAYIAYAEVVANSGNTNRATGAAARVIKGKSFTNHDVAKIRRAFNTIADHFSREAE